MARTPMVSRELIGTEAKALQLDLKAEKMEEVTLTIKGKYKTAENLLKALQKAYDTDDIKIMKIIDFKLVRKLYGMPEKQYFAEAVELNPETRKPLAE